MSATDITVIAFSRTYHVLGAITRSAGPPSSETVQDLTGTTGLVLRVPGRPDLQIVVASSNLTNQNVAANDALMMNPTSFQLTGNPPTTVSALAPYAVPPATLAVNPVVLDGATVTVTLPANLPTDGDVYVQVGTTLAKITIPADKAQGTAIAQAPPGDNAYLLIAPGYPALVGYATVQQGAF
jgi:hypothetical protein